MAILPEAVPVDHKDPNIQEKKLVGQCLHGELLQLFQDRVLSSALFLQSQRGQGCRTQIYSFL
ncbi:Hypothetical protein BSM4216_3474 [Bacillus smithii]|nr:Hypothetical protein BSM4216_3474 [Bacillus smithii]